MHKAEGGDIAAARQPPPGYNLPYPNLASVPPVPHGLTLQQDLAISQQLAQARAAPSLPTSIPDPAADVAIGGLSLPGGPPPEPEVPGIDWQGLPQAPLPPAPPAPTKTPPPVQVAGPAVLLAFAPRSALLDPLAQRAARDLASGRGNAKIRAGGFGEQGSAPDAAALALGIARARRIADALTAAGVPPHDITLMAAAAGSGGYAQLVY